MTLIALTSLFVLSLSESRVLFLHFMDVANHYDRTDKDNCQRCTPDSPIDSRVGYGFTECAVAQIESHQSECQSVVKRVEYYYRKYRSGADVGIAQNQTEKCCAEDRRKMSVNHAEEER